MNIFGFVQPWIHLSLALFVAHSAAAYSYSFNTFTSYSLVTNESSVFPVLPCYGFLLLLLLLLLVSIHLFFSQYSFCATANHWRLTLNFLKKWKWGCIAVINVHWFVYIHCIRYICCSLLKKIQRNSRNADDMNERM